MSSPLFAQEITRLPSVQELKKLPLEELMDIEVTLVSREPQKLMKTASAIQVIRADEIRRSGATRLPEALRLASNLQVAQSNSHDWGITARGFNGAPLANSTSANKLLVMIDGRTVYTPLFGGVFWDVQNILLEDVERIEVVSGPGGTMWGANAVNGVINVVSKSAKDTQGLYATALAGTFFNAHFAARYGFKVSDNVYARVYSQHFDQSATTLSDGSETGDAWRLTQAGFRVDFDPNVKSSFSFLGDFYQGKETGDGDIVDGQNIIGKWQFNLSETSGLAVQLYYDRTWRDLGAQSFNEDLQTFDLDFQHQFQLAKSHELMWGMGYRLMRDNINNTAALSFTPPERDLDLIGIFVQDEITVVPDKFNIAIGTKLQRNVYSGWEIQPTARMLYTPSDAHSFWAAISRAVRTPTRWDADEVTPFLITPDQQFDAESVVAYELGYKINPNEKILASISTYFNEYDQLRSINANPLPPPDLIFANDLTGESYGVEATVEYSVNSSWHLRGGYTFLNTNFETESPAVLPISTEFEAIDPRQQFLFQSILDLDEKWRFDITGRYISSLADTEFTPYVPEYFTFDARVAYRHGIIQFEVVGRNLAQEYHTEFGSRRIPRSVYGRITCRL